MSAVDKVQSAVTWVMSAVVELHNCLLDVRTLVGVYKTRVGGVIKYRNVLGGITVVNFY